MCQTIVPSWKRLTLALEQGTLDWAVGNRARIQQGTLNQSSIHLTYLLSITKKKAEHQRTDAFELWCWRRLLRVPWTVRRSNQSILKDSPEYSLERLMLKLKLQYFSHLMRRTDSFVKTLMLEASPEGRRRRGWQRMRWLDGITLILWPLDAKNLLICKDPDAGGISWRQEEKGMTENEVVGWHYRLNRHEFE